METLRLLHAVLEVGSKTTLGFEHVLKDTSLMGHPHHSCSGLIILCTNSSVTPALHNAVFEHDDPCRLDSVMFDFAMQVKHLCWGTALVE